MRFNQVFVLLVMAAMVLMASLFISPIMAFALIPAFCIGILLIGHPRPFLYIFLTFLGTYPLVKSIFPGATAYLNEGMAVSLWIIFFGHIFFRRFDFSSIKKWILFAGAFSGYTVLTYLLNRGSMKAAVQYYCTYLTIVPFFLLARHYCGKKDIKLMFTWSIVIFWVSFILNLGWWTGVNPLPNIYIDIHSLVDRCIGTLGGANYVAYYCVMLLYLLFGMITTDGMLTKRQRLVASFTVLAIFVQLYFTFTNHAYLFAGVGLVVYVVLSGSPIRIILSISRRWYIWFILFVLIAVALPYMKSDERVSMNYEDGAFAQRMDKLADSAKIQLFNDLLISNAKEAPFEWLVGLGPGNGMGPIGKDNQTPFALSMLLDYYQQANMRASQMTSVTGTTDSAIFTLWGDFGLIGFCLFTGLMGTTLIMVRGMMNSKNNEKRTLSGFVFCAAIFFFIVNLVGDRLGSMHMFWLLFFIAILFPEKKWADESPSDSDPSREVAQQNNLGQREMKTDLIPSGRKYLSEPSARK